MKSHSPLTTYPLGTPDAAEPSGMAPPTSDALPSYSLTYSNDFSGASPLAGWDVYSGSPGSDPNSIWAKSHVVVNGGVLQLNATPDPQGNNVWDTGGLCQCSVVKTYAAYFVRSRISGPGATQVELLWPAGSLWPPEVDFNETFGGDTSSKATVHYTSANLQDQRNLTIDMTQWHTWGVVWTPTSITYTVDGRAWGRISVPAEIPRQPMTLDIQQQTFCALSWACPTSPQSLEVNWVAEYSPIPDDPVSIGPFELNSATLTSSLKYQLVHLAHNIKYRRYNLVSLVGYGDSTGSRAQNLSLSRARAARVRKYLVQQLASLRVTGVVITSAGKGNVTSGTPSSGTQPQTGNQRVLAEIS